MNNPANQIYGQLTVRLNTTLPADDGTQLTAVTGATDTLTKTAHGLVTGQKVRYVSGTGFTGLTAAAIYWAIKLTADTFKLATTLALAKAGTPITVGTSSAGVFTPTGLQALPSSYAVEFGNVVKSSTLPKSELQEHYGSYKGVKKRDKKRRKKSSLGYEITTDELDPSSFAILMGAPSGSAPDPGRPQDFYGIAYMEQENEPLNADGSGIYNHYGFFCTVTSDGSFDLDGETEGEVKFMIDVNLGIPGVYVASTRPVT